MGHGEKRKPLSSGHLAVTSGTNSSAVDSSFLSFGSQQPNNPSIRIQKNSQKQRLSFHSHLSQL
jgi:hypothetical protein